MCEKHVADSKTWSLEVLLGKKGVFMALLWLAMCAMANAMTFVDEAELKVLTQTRGYMLGRPSQIRFSPQGEALYFLRAKPGEEGLALFEFVLATKEERELVNAKQLLGGAKEQLSTEEKAQRERSRSIVQGIAGFELSKEGKHILLALSGALYAMELPSARVVHLGPKAGAALNARFSPDAKHIAYVKDFDVYVINLRTRQHRRLTRGGTEVRSHGVAEFVAQEEFGRTQGYWFSPSGQHILFQQTDHRGMERMEIPPPPPQADTFQGKSTSFFYPRAGKPNAKVRLGLVSIGGGPTTWVEWDNQAFPYLLNIRWTKAGNLILSLLNRPQTKLVLLEVDGKTGKRIQTLWEEEDEAWVNVDQSFPIWLSDGSGFFWRTERNGAPEIEFHSADGRYVQTWIKAQAGFSQWVGIDEKRETVFFSGGANPTESQLYATTRAGEPKLVYGKPGEMAFGRWDETAGRMLLSTVSLKAMPRQWVLDEGGELLVEVPSVAREPRLSSQVDIFQLAGGIQPWVRVVKPSHFSAKHRYPVILEIYGGPHVQEVLQSLPHVLGLQWLANQGFIVISFDVRGTPGRGRAWERAIFHNFAELISREQVEALRALAEEVPQMDMSRVGVMGASFGGYMAAILVMGYPEVFRAGLAMAPVVDWRDYDSAYTERYLGIPEEHPEVYEKNSVLSYVDKAQRPLLLVHGTSDDNVYFFHTLKLTDALFRQGKFCEVLPLVNATHMLGADKETAQRLWELRTRFFQKHLHTD